MIVEEMKERAGGERKMNESEETEEIKTPPSTFTCCKDSRPCPTVSKYQLHAGRRRKIHDTFASPNHHTGQRVYSVLEHLSDLEVFFFVCLFFFFFFCLFVFLNSAKVLIQQ